MGGGVKTYPVALIHFSTASIYGQKILSVRLREHILVVYVWFLALNILGKNSEDNILKYFS